MSSMKIETKRLILNMLYAFFILMATNSTTHGAESPFLNWSSVRYSLSENGKPLAVPVVVHPESFGVPAVSKHCVFLDEVFRVAPAGGPLYVIEQSS